MLLKVKGFMPTPNNERDLECFDENGKKHYVDFIVDGSLPENISAEDLIGKTIEVEYLTPYIEIACNCRIVAVPDA